ncbi:MAG: hypothetical protein U0359_14405 [Byssovorax sp.]
MRRLLPAALLSFTACAEPLPSPAPPPPATGSPSASIAAPAPSATTAPSAVASAAPPPPARPAAKMGAPIDGKLALVASCTTSAPQRVQVWPVGKGMLGMCGMSVQASAMFYVPETGAARLAPEVLKDVPMRTARDGGTYGLFSISGPDLDHLDAEIGELMTRTGVSYKFHKDGKRWKNNGGGAWSGSDFYCGGPCVEIDGRALVEREGRGQPSHFEYVGDVQGWIPSRAKVSGCDTPVHGFSLLFRRGKELWGIGKACAKAAVQRWTVGKTETSAEALDLPAREEQMYGRDVALSGGRVLYQSNDGRDVALFDGNKWTALASDQEAQGLDVIQKAGAVWLEGGRRLRRLEGTRLVEIPLPEELIHRVVISDRGELRIWTGKALYSLDRDDAWHPVTLPPGVGEFSSLEAVGDRWVMRFNGTGADQDQLFVEGASGPPLTIDNPDTAVSPIALVRPLTSYCEHPFAVLYKLAKTAPKDYDFPATKKALENNPRLSAGRFSEIAALGDRFLIGRYEGPRAVEQLGELVKLVEKKVQGSKPQLLCADALSEGLPVTRDVSLK